MKKLLFLLFFAATAAQAQRMGSVNGQILDGMDSRMMADATIKFRSVADTTFVRGANSMPDGKFVVSGLPYGDYTIEVTFVGYEDYLNKVTVNTRNMTVAPFYMARSTLEMDEVVVSTQMIRVSMHGDTIIYNPKAFKVAEDADAEAIIKQLPGVEVQDGNVKVQGKNVAQILVDGKETYGTDVAQTMKTIPAEMLEEIEVYEKLSDFAETTGVNDGDEYTVMNFVTGIKFAHFGDLSAMYGHEDMYAAGARWNIVTGDHLFGINAGANNTGATAAFDDMVAPGMFGGGGHSQQWGSRGGGISTNTKMRNGMGGLTWNYETKENFRFNTSYRYGHAESDRKNDSETRYFDNPLYDMMLRNSKSSNNNNNHNFGASSRWKIDKHSTLNARLSGSYSDSRSSSLGEQTYFDEAVADAVQYFLNNHRGKSDFFNLQGQVNYGLRIGTKGRSVRVGVNGNSRNNNGNSWADSHTQRKMTGYPLLDSLGNSRSVNDVNGHSMMVQAEYFEPMTRYLRLKARYSLNYNVSDNKFLTEKLSTANVWQDWNEGSGISDEKNYEHKAGLGLNYRKNNNEFRIDVDYQYKLLTGERTLPLPTWSSRIGYKDVVYSAEYQKQITPQKRFNIDLSADTQTPSLDDLQGVDDISTNGLIVYGGNPGLKPYYYHNFSAGYNSYNLRNSSSFSMWISGQLSMDSFGSDRHIVTEDGGWLSPNGTLLTPGQEYTRMVNIDKKSWSANLSSYYGRPLRFIKSNWGTGLNFFYSEMPGRVNGEENTSSNFNTTFYTSLNSNFSENLTFGLYYAFGQSWGKNSNEKYGKTGNIGHSLNLDFYWLTWKNFVLRANMMYSHRRLEQANFEKDYVQEQTMANVALGKKLFKNRRGELTFAVNDLFDNGKTNNSSPSVDRITYSTDYGLGRYYSLTFSYRLRDFSRGKDGAGRRFRRQ